METINSFQIRQAFLWASLPSTTTASLRAAVLWQRHKRKRPCSAYREKMPPAIFSLQGASRNACLILVLVFLMTGVNGFADDMVHRMDGYVEHVDPEKRKLTVLFEHPVTEEIMKKEFFVLEDTGFKDFKKLSDLKKDDLLTIDYREDGPRSNAIYVIRVPLKKAYMTRQELAGALTQIKTGKEK